MDRWAQVLSSSSSSSLRYCRLLLRPQHTLSHLFYLLLHPQQTHPSPVLLPPPSLAVPLSPFFLPFPLSSLSLSAAACVAFTPPATDLFTCNPSLPDLLFLLFLPVLPHAGLFSRMKQEHIEGEMDFKGGPVDKSLRYRSKQQKKKRGDSYAV